MNSEESKQIPKRVFYVWGANEPKRTDVNLCLRTWREVLKDYEIIEINENDTTYFDFKKEIESNKWFKTVYQNKMFAYVADYIRVKVLYEHGGIYLDTDVSVLQSFDKYLSNPAFVGIQHDSSIGNNNLEPAILGAQKGNSLLERILKFYDAEIWKEPIYTMPQLFDKAITQKYGRIFYPEKVKQEVITLEEITIYPERVFIPMRVGTAFSEDLIEKETATIHWYGGSWVKGNIEYFLKNKHKADLNHLLKKCFSAKVIVDNPFLKIEKLHNKYSIKADFNYVFKFRHKYFGKTRYLVLFVCGKQIKLWAK